MCRYLTVTIPLSFCDKPGSLCPVMSFPGVPGMSPRFRNVPGRPGSVMSGYDRYARLPRASSRRRRTGHRTLCGHISAVHIRLVLVCPGKPARYVRVCPQRSRGSVPFCPVLPRSVPVCPSGSADLAAHRNNVRRHPLNGPEIKAGGLPPMVWCHHMTLGGRALNGRLRAVQSHVQYMGI